MIRKLIFSICMICPLLAGCTDDDMMPSSQMPLSSETVPVRLNFSTEAFKRAEQQGHAERDCVQLQDAGDHGDHAPRVVRVREEAEEDDHADPLFCPPLLNVDCQ